MAAARHSRWALALWRIKIAMSVALGCLALDLPFTASPLFFVCSAILLGLALTAFTRLMFRPSPRESVAPRRRKQIALAVTTSVLGFVLVILAAAILRVGDSEEFGRLRTLAGQAMRPQSSDPELGWAPLAPPGVVGQRLHTMDPNRRRILLIGDSIVYGLHLRDEETAGHVLESRLPGWQVLNGAVSGYSIDQYHLYLRRVIRQVRPEIVVIGVFTGNDFQITGREFCWGTSKPLFALQNGELVRANVGNRCIDILDHSLLFRALWTDRALAQRGIAALCHPRQLQPREQERVVSRLFDAIDETARSAGVPVLWTLLPTRQEYSGESVRFLYLSRHRTILHLLEEHPREVLDFAVHTAQQADEGSVYLDDNAHMTARGHRLLADVMHHAITTRFPFVR